MPKEMRIAKYEQYKGSIYTYEVDLTVLDQELGVTSSAVTWSTEDSNVVSIGTRSFASKIASAPITASNVGEAHVKLTITTDVIDKPVYYFVINVLDPKNERNRIWR